MCHPTLIDHCFNSPSALQGATGWFIWIVRRFSTLLHNSGALPSYVHHILSRRSVSTLLYVNIYNTVAPISDDWRWILTLSMTMMLAWQCPWCHRWGRHHDIDFSPLFFGWWDESWKLEERKTTPPHILDGRCWDGGMILLLKYLYQY
jgi:hypothetical protein